MDAGHPAALANLEDQGVRGDEGVRAGVQGWLRNAWTGRLIPKDSMSLDNEGFREGSESRTACRAVRFGEEDFRKGNGRRRESTPDV